MVLLVLVRVSLALFVGDGGGGAALAVAGAEVTEEEFEAEVGALHDPLPRLYLDDEARRRRWRRGRKRAEGTALLFCPLCPPWPNIASQTERRLTPERFEKLLGLLDGRSAAKLRLGFAPVFESNEDK